MRLTTCIPVITIHAHVANVQKLTSSIEVDENSISSLQAEEDILLQVTYMYMCV